MITLYSWKKKLCHDLVNLRFFAPLRLCSYTCSPSYTDEEEKTNVDSETVCLRLLIKGLIVPIRLSILSIAYY